MTGPWPINALQYNDTSMSTETDCGKIPHLCPLSGQIMVTVELTDA